MLRGSNNGYRGSIITMGKMRIEGVREYLIKGAKEH